MQRIGRTAKDPVKLRRAIVVLMSAQGQSAPDIAHLLDCPPEYARGVIHDSSDMGFGAPDPEWSGGRPKAVSEQARRLICLIARCRPRDPGPVVQHAGLGQARGVPGGRPGTRPGCARPAGAPAGCGT